jgi:hypothetical protein
VNLHLNILFALTLNIDESLVNASDASVTWKELPVQMHKGLSGKDVH